MACTLKVERLLFLLFKLDFYIYYFLIQYWFLDFKASEGAVDGFLELDFTRNFIWFNYPLN
jgi:hypothetical protein